MSDHEKLAGKRICEQAYAQGKMLDHSGWYGKLIRNGVPTKGTPSDVDFIFLPKFILDNRGTFLFGELSSADVGWEDLVYGQRTMYENLLKAAGGTSVSVLCHHSVPSDTQIDTYTDIKSFIPMIWANGQICRAERFVGVERWQKFYPAWFADPLKIYKWLCEHS